MSGDIIHIDIDDESEESSEAETFLLDIGQAAVVCFNRADTYLAGEIAGLDRIGVLINGWWKTEDGIEQIQESYVPWFAIESIDKYKTVDEAVGIAWGYLSVPA